MDHLWGHVSWVVAQVITTQGQYSHNVIMLQCHACAADSAPYQPLAWSFDS